MTEFHSTLVDVNAVSKGTRTGGIRRFTALAVIGNYDVSAPYAPGTIASPPFHLSLALKSRIKSHGCISRRQLSNAAEAAQRHS